MRENPRIASASAIAAENSPPSPALFELIELAARAALGKQSPNGSFPPGHNGPYGDPETPVRNTSHWLITLLKAHEISGSSEFLDAAKRASAYLMSEEVRPGGASWWHRTSDGRDSCNGLMGQAWTIEALVLAGKALDDSSMHKLAEDVFLAHTFNPDVALWKILEIDGSQQGYDHAINHQIWFAAAGCLLQASSDASDVTVGGTVSRFLDSLEVNLTLYDSGLIKHAIARITPQRRIRSARQLAGAIIRLRGRRARNVWMVDRAVGYHSFNLYALALLRQGLPDHPIWGSDLIRRAVNHVDSSEYLGAIEGSSYGYPYNPPGFENAFALHVFRDLLDSDVDTRIVRWINKQLTQCFDFDTNSMNRCGVDPETQSARFYEACRLPDIQGTQ